MIRNLAAKLKPIVVRRSHWFGVLLAAGLTMAGLSGCGGEFGAPREPVQPVKGQVLLDGKPLTTGFVVLVSSKNASEHSGEIGSDGHFTVKTGDVEGAPQGEYRIRIEPEAKKGQGPRPKKTAATLPYPGRYADETTSDLTATVKPGENNLELKLSKSSSASKKSKDDSAND